MVLEAERSSDHRTRTLRAVDCPNRFQRGEVPMRGGNRNGIIPRLVAATRSTGCDRQRPQPSDPSRAHRASMESLLSATSPSSPALVKEPLSTNSTSSSGTLTALRPRIAPASKPLRCSRAAEEAESLVATIEVPEDMYFVTARRAIREALSVAGIEAEDCCDARLQRIYGPAAGGHGLRGRPLGSTRPRASCSTSSSSVSAACRCC